MVLKLIPTWLNGPKAALAYAQDFITSIIQNLQLYKIIFILQEQGVMQDFHFTI